MSILDRRLITAQQVAALLNRRPQWFYMNRKKLVSSRGFPEPVFAGMYDPVAVAAWLDAQLAPHLRAVLEAKRPPSPDATADTDWEAELRANAERIAGERGGAAPPVH